MGNWTIGLGELIGIETTTLVTKSSSRATDILTQFIRPDSPCLKPVKAVEPALFTSPAQALTESTAWSRPTPPTPHPPPQLLATGAANRRRQVGLYLVSPGSLHHQIRLIGRI